MKRDMDLVRAILLEVESATGGVDVGGLCSGERTVEKVCYHVELLNDRPFSGGHSTNIDWIVRPKYNPRLRSYGKTYAERVFPGYNRVTGIDIGPQKNDDVLNLI